MTVCGCLLSRSLLGVKRTCRLALHMSAIGPKAGMGLIKMCGLSLPRRSSRPVV